MTNSAPAPTTISHIPSPVRNAQSPQRCRIRPDPSARVIAATVAAARRFGNPIAHLAVPSRPVSIDRQPGDKGGFTVASNFEGLSDAPASCRRQRAEFIKQALSHVVSQLETGNRSWSMAANWTLLRQAVL